MTNTQDEQNNNQNTRTLFTIPVNGCLITIILLAMCCGAITECRRSRMRYEMDEIEYKKFMENIKSQQKTKTFVWNQNLQLEK